MAGRTYKRDANGRFAGGGGGSKGRPAAKKLERGTNNLTRDNAGKITSVGGSGATARGGRIRTAAGNKRATVTTRLKGPGKAGRVVKPKVGKIGASQSKKVQKIQVSEDTLKAKWRRVGRVEQRAQERWMSLPTGARSKDPSTPAGKRLAKSMETANRANAFVKAMTWAKDGSGTARAANFKGKPRYSTKSKIRPTWGAGRLSSF